MRLLWFLPFICAFQATAQPVEFDPSDFGKIVISPRQSTSGLTLEQAFGDYQNEPVVTYGENGPAVRMGRPVGRLDLMYENGKPGFCTAFIVDADHILTNHHCIPGMNGDVTGAASGVAAAQFVAGYIKPGHDAGTDKYTVSTQIVETNRELDYTVLRVFGDPSAKYGKMELASADPEDSEFLWIIGHPQGQSQHISREGCAASTPAISGEGKLVHTCDTMGGNSGSPVIRISDRMVIGLHHAGDNRTGFNMAIPMRRILENSDVLVAAAVRAETTAPVDPAAQVCTAMWAEAKTLGCLGYETYLDECATHSFASFARNYVNQNCTAAAVTVPENPAIAPKPEIPATTNPAIEPPSLRSAGKWTCQRQEIGNDTYEAAIDIPRDGEVGARIFVQRVRNRNDQVLIGFSQYGQDRIEQVLKFDVDQIRTNSSWNVGACDHCLFYVPNPAYGTSRSVFSIRYPIGGKNGLIRALQSGANLIFKYRVANPDDDPKKRHPRTLRVSLNGSQEAIDDLILGNCGQG